MKYLLLSIFIILTNLGFGQNNDKQELGLKSENEKWIQNLEKMDSKEMQVHFIIEKIKQDSIIDFKKVSDKVIIKHGENINDALKRQTKCKIVFVLFQKKVGHLLDLNEYPNYSVILKYLTNETINSIEILKEEKATSLFGSRAVCGVIKLNSDDRKLKKLIKRSLRK